MRFRSLLSCSMLLVAVWASLPAEAAVTLPNIFGDHMVLQRHQANKIWGRAEPGEVIVCVFGNQQVTTTAGEDGQWSLQLAPMDASRRPQQLVITGRVKAKSSTGKDAVSTKTIEDVLVGEVWICSGQSNMEWRVANSNDPDLERVSAYFPEIRMVSFPNVGTQEPVWTHEGANWQVCSPETVDGFSAVGYFFGRQLYQVIDVPIGLIDNSWGGSACEAWISREVMEASGKFDARLSMFDNQAKELVELSSVENPSEEQKRAIARLNGNLRGNQRPANLYNGILKSHLGYGIRGAIWYQGESNAGRAYAYRDLFPLMIDSWREEWGQGDFPFYWVQLADFRAEQPEPSDSAWAELREAQTMTMSRLKHTGEAVIIDIGEDKDIHPRNKVDVGRRLARWALANEYGIDIAYHSPIYKSMEVGDGKITLTFDHVDNGWRPFDKSEPIGFAIAASDKKFVWADAKIIRETGQIEVSSSQVAEPVAVRYAWADNPVCNMYDGATLPLTPFRTDDWPGVTVDAE
ncbi:MAG: sialate O-acetylesterase [Planctomycetales bacterium]|nr:sialate O-acetylesterase [Planctomycetales bacterium]